MLRTDTNNLWINAAGVTLMLALCVVMFHFNRKVDADVTSALAFAKTTNACNDEVSSLERDLAYGYFIVNLHLVYLSAKRAKECFSDAK